MFTFSASQIITEHVMLIL